MRRWGILFAGAKYLFVSTVVAGSFLVASSVGWADGMAPPAPPMAQAPTSWSGLYFGTQSGYVWSSMDADPTTGAGTGTSVDHSAEFVGGQLGLQHQFGNVVLGIETGMQVAFRNNPTSTTCALAGVCAAAGSQLTSRFDDVLSVGPRLGWAMGKWMPYLTAGYANAAFTNQVTNNAVVQAEARTRHNGWYIGAGVDMAVVGGWTMGLEYRHYDFGDVDATLHTPTGALVGNPINFDPTADTISLRVSWKLDRVDRAPPPLK